jgi:2',3'-cyclic-nucleotide 2'-phosphodiesterase (5'-nucleotidase family)
MNKTAFVLSVVLTTFVLMAFGGVVYALRAPEVATATQSVEEVVVEAAPTADPSLEQTLLEREQIYQQRIAEANARLAQAQAQLAGQSSLAGQTANSQAALTSITPEQAAQIAADAFGQGVAWVEIVTVKGEDLYLVTLTSGDLVYVSMTGQVVGSAPAQYSGTSGGGGRQLVSNETSSGGEGEHEDEHEEEHEGEGGDD